MADQFKGIWEQKNGSYTSSDSDTESETEVSSIYGLDKSGFVRPLATSNVAPAAGKGKSGPAEGNRSCSRTVANRKRNGEERMPTRRPDPNVLNRNALLARENRRRKKLYLESVESELHDARRANRALVKALKRQVKVSQRLEQEKRYFQNILANQSEISSLVNTFNKRRQVSIDQQSTSSWEAFAESPNRERQRSTCSSSSFDLDPLQSPFGAASNDLDNADNSGYYSHSSWDDIWQTSSTTLSPESGEVSGEVESQFPQITTLGKENLHDSMDDHNYVVTSVNKQTLNMPSLTSGSEASSSASRSVKATDSVGDQFQGVCLHLTREHHECVLKLLGCSPSFCGLTGSSIEVKRIPHER